MLDHGVGCAQASLAPRSVFALRKSPATGNERYRERSYGRGIALICATLFRALVLSVALAGALTPVRCLGEDGNQLPEKATKELSPELLSLLQQKHMPKHSPIILRVFKEEAELEVWKQDTTGHFQILKTYPICRWSGDLGPKLHEGDRQTPEGFYTITPKLMNPNSNFYLAINTGFPNSFDKANDRDGTFLMIHGDCSSSGCYAMTDEQIGEIYALARDSFLGGHPSFQVQAYPFRMTPANLARHRTNPHMAFWKMLKIGNDHFETTHLQPKVDVCDRRYVFDAQPAPEFVAAACVRSERSMPRLCRQSENRSGGDWRNNVPTRSNTRNWSKTTCQSPQSTADSTAE